MAKAEKTGAGVYRERHSFAKIPGIVDVPNLIAIQTDSFKWFMEEGITEAFNDVCPIENSTKDMCVELGEHHFGEPKYTVDECKEKDVSYQAPLYAKIRFINRETGEIKDQNDLFMGDFPLMTPRGTFIINGTERVVVSQARSFARHLFQRRARQDVRQDHLRREGYSFSRRMARVQRPTSATFCRFASTASASSRPRCFCAPSASPTPAKKSSISSAAPRWFCARSIATPRPPRKRRSSSCTSVSVRASLLTIDDSARTLLDGLFFNPQRYDLAKVGRHKANREARLRSRIRRFYAHH